MSQRGGGIRGNSGGVNRGNHGGNSGRGRGGGGQTGSNSVNKSNNVRFQTGNNYNNTNYNNTSYNNTSYNNTSYNNTSYKSTYYARNDNPIVKLSKSLSSVLRHNAIEYGLKIQPDGYVKVDELRKLSRFRQTTLEEIQHVVKENDKKRFTLLEEKSESGESIWWIKANQGHSLAIVKDLQLDLITDPSKIPQVVHGTYLSSWEHIKLQGLSKMNRNHIHLAVGRFGDADVISGMRQSCDVFIYVNVPEAMTDNIKFFKSANGVILTEGINGILDKKYFLKVIDKYDNVLYETSSKGNNNNNVNRNNVDKNVEGINADDIKRAKENNNNKNVDSKNIDVNNNAANENNNKKGDNDNKGNNNASGNIIPKTMNSGGTNESNDNKGNNAARNGNNVKIMNPGGTNDNKLNNTVWNGNNARIMNPGSVWDGNNTKIMNGNRTNENKGNNNVWNKPKSMNVNSMNDNRNKIVENNNKSVNTSSVNVNKNNNYNNDKKSDNNKRKNDNKDDDKGKKVFSYADVTKRQT